ncbi:MAG: ureidoglycolate lyase [Streptosporangiaceae bacterium]
MVAFARSIQALQFDAAGWSAYGWTPVADTDPRDGTSRLHFEWADAHLNLIGHDFDEVPHTPGGVLCEMLYRHLTHTQALLILNCPAIVVTAPPGTEFRGPADAEKLRAFLLKPLDSFVLHCGTWHWGPFPISAPRVEMYNIQGLRYAEDNDCARLDRVGASVEVLTGSGAAHQARSRIT